LAGKTIVSRSSSSKLVVAGAGSSCTQRSSLGASEQSFRNTRLRSWMKPPRHFIGRPKECGSPTCAPAVESQRQARPRMMELDFIE
jgi:hypothetical protein